MTEKLVVWPLHCTEPLNVPAVDGAVRATVAKMPTSAVARVNSVSGIDPVTAEADQRRAASYAASLVEQRGRS